MSSWLLGGLSCWIILNVVAPYSILLKAERISFGRLPAELLVLPEGRKVRFYMSDLYRGYGFSVWAPPLNIVVFDRRFFQRADPKLLRYVVAHELAHFTLQHHIKRWCCIVSGIVLFPIVRKWLNCMEDEADEMAARRIGLPRAAFPELGGKMSEKEDVKTMEVKQRRSGETKVVVHDLNAEPLVKNVLDEKKESSPRVGTAPS